LTFVQEEHCLSRTTSTSGDTSVAFGSSTSTDDSDTAVMYCPLMPELSSSALTIGRLDTPRPLGPATGDGSAGGEAIGGCLAARDSGGMANPGGKDNKIWRT